MTEVQNQRLLGRLAELSWFRKNGEVAATRALTMLLEHTQLRTALLSSLREQTGVDLGVVERFVAEQVHVDGARPDIEGLDTADRPVLVIEAKFNAPLTAQQIESYLADQLERLHVGQEGRPSPCAVFAVLVPEQRMAEATLKVENAMRNLIESAPDLSRVVTTVLSWNQWLDRWDVAWRHDEAPDAQLRSDLEQLRAMCLALGGVVIAPLADSASGSTWRDREDAYRALTDDVTRRLAGPDERLAPINDECDFFARRYFASGYTASSRPRGAAAMGINGRFADEGGTPLWVRFHAKTPGFAAIRDTITGSRYAAGARRDQKGHLWLPLSVDAELAGPEIADDLYAQVQDIRLLLADSSGPPPRQKSSS